MPRTAVVTPVGTSPKGNGEASKLHVDDLIQRGRSQGHLSLSELRTAFEQAGIAPAEGRSILRELTDAGVRMADQPATIEVDTYPGKKWKAHVSSISPATIRCGPHRSWARSPSASRWHSFRCSCRLGRRSLASAKVLRRTLPRMPM